MAQVCPICSRAYSGIGVVSTTGCFCSNTCAAVAAGVGSSVLEAFWQGHAHFGEIRKRVESRVVESKPLHRELK